MLPRRFSDPGVGQCFFALSDPGLGHFFTVIERRIYRDRGMVPSFLPGRFSDPGVGQFFTGYGSVRHHRMYGKNQRLYPRNRPEKSRYFSAVPTVKLSVEPTVVCAGRTVGYRRCCPVVLASPTVELSVEFAVIDAKYRGSCTAVLATRKWDSLIFLKRPGSGTAFLRATREWDSF